MSKKPAFSFKTIKTEASDVSSPFWAKRTTKTSKTKDAFKTIWKWAKLIILLFFFVMGLWGCFQSSFDSTVSTSKNIGSGLEFGFNFGQTGNWQYDLMSSSLDQYHTFNSWTMAYGPFYAWFVWPGAWLTMQISWLLHSWWGGINVLMALFVLIVLIRVLSISVTIKSALQNEKMSEVRGKISDINAKYKGLKDAQSRQMKQQETMAIYKKNNIKPFAAFEQLLLTLPIFLIVYRVVTILRPMKSTILFNIWNFSYTPSTQVMSSLTHGGWVYIFFILLVIPVQFFSTWFPQILAKKRNRGASASSFKGQKENKKNSRYQYIFAGAMSLIVVFTPTGVGVYWFFNAIMAIAQSYIMHLIIMKQRRKTGTKLKVDSIVLE